jgi:prolipoprotein diacylglyceryltransferase
MQTLKKQSNFLIIFFVALTCVLTGGFIGATTNMINGAVSPHYFKVVMYWNFKDIWTASVAQGILEGLTYGIFFSIVFTTGFGIITRGQSTFGFALEQLLKVIFIVYSCWTIGGLVAMFLATLSPDFYRSHFPLTPTDKSEMIKFAWVGGSIWGGMTGGLLSAILGIVVTKNSWTKKYQTHTTEKN